MLKCRGWELHVGVVELDELGTMLVWLAFSRRGCLSNGVTVGNFVF